MSQKHPTPKQADHHEPSADPTLSEPKFVGVPPQGPSPAPGIARHFSQEHDRAAEAGRLGGKPSAAEPQQGAGKKG